MSRCRATNTSVDLMKYRKESQRRDQQQGQTRKFYSSFDGNGWLDTFSNKDSHQSRKNLSGSPLPEIKDYVEFPVNGGKK